MKYDTKILYYVALHETEKRNTNMSRKTRESGIDWRNLVPAEHSAASNSAEHHMKEITWKCIHDQRKEAEGEYRTKVRMK